MLSLYRACKKYYNYRQCNGYITLISVLVVGAVGIAITVSLLLLGLGSTQTSFALAQSAQARANANFCIEDVLEQIRDNVYFSGNGNIVTANGDCDYSVTSQGGHNRTINATGTVDTIVKKVKVVINRINPSISIASWQEVSDF
jgi:hypothetical protein